MLVYCEDRYCFASANPEFTCKSCRAKLCRIHGDHKRLKDGTMESCPICRDTGKRKE